MTRSRKGLVHIDDVALEYSIDGSGIPLLVVGSSVYYPRTFSANLRQSCTLVCADLPHFVNLSPEFSLQAINFEFYSRCIEAVRVDAGLGKVVIVGHSHHGNVALEYARRNPTQVSHVVMIGSPPVDVSRTIAGAEQYWASSASEERKAILKDRRQAVDKDRLARLSPSEAYIAQYVTDAPLYWNDPTYDAAWVWEGMQFRMEAIHAFRDLYKSYELHWDSQSLKAPVLIIAGRNDFAVPPTLWESVLPKLRNTTFHLLEDSGHTPQLEQAEAFDNLLLSWLRSQR
ncbi:hypothetical protein CAI21_07315 [Alkalilimnicola ehrlichii]|uniref:AB hydrolase-1 domain-containing protein n=1 Tax=Alkalilimnicola ehrlichii TaxID=351052 RepID=A0A3E0WYX3_9GAMM|nr:alpha/beta hydrolase [Alkalilimnicola ehrlichii]RFA30018.1 hypothetical protein CAI21_07315 [Alkalilimnicola ehrlichii]RFA37363.1 hypothetical protein CAL65_08650 [Alkalilimnicola ehrlichii]